MTLGYSRLRESTKGYSRQAGVNPSKRAIKGEDKAHLDGLFQNSNLLFGNLVERQRHLRHAYLLGVPSNHSVHKGAHVLTGLLEVLGVEQERITQLVR